MTHPTHTIERLIPPFDDADLRALARLLVDTVDSGSAVSFLAPLPLERAEAWWRQIAASSDPRSIFLVARDAEGIVGSVQLHPAWAPNQPHRADVARMLVRRSARRRGIGRLLMERAEREARTEGRTLLVLDTVTGDDAERLYERLGWRRVGVIPGYALYPDGRPCDTTVFWKAL